jgi:hypothetical protein
MPTFVEQDKHDDRSFEVKIDRRILGLRSRAVYVPGSAGDEGSRIST